MARRARIPDNAIGGGPLAHIDAPVDAGALHSKHRVDSAKPLQRTVFQVSRLMSSSTVKKIGAPWLPPAAVCSCQAVRASATPPANPRVKSDGADPPGLPYW